MQVRSARQGVNHATPTMGRSGASRRQRLLTGAVTLVLGTSAVIGAPVGAQERASTIPARNDPGYRQTTRVATESRAPVDVALAWSRATNEDGQHTDVLLGRDGGFADALASSALSCQLDAPLLLTSTYRLSDGVTEELRRLGARTVHLLGGFGALSRALERDLSDLGLGIRRYTGASRVETALTAAAAHFGSARVVFLVRAYGRDAEPTQAFADSLAAGGAACAAQAPLLLSAEKRLLPSIREHLEQSSAERIVLVGGEGAISADVERELQGMGLTVERVGGASRAATAVALAGLGESEPPAVALVNGWHPDGWASGMAAALWARKAGARILLAADGPAAPLPEVTRDYLRGLSAGEQVACGPFVSPYSCRRAGAHLDLPEHIRVSLDNAGIPDESGLVTGELGGRWESVWAWGCGLDELVSYDSGGRFALRPQVSERGCLLEFITIHPGGEKQRDVFQIRSRVNTGLTTLPELVRADLIHAGVIDPDGRPENGDEYPSIRVRYVFDEMVFVPSQNGGSRTFALVGCCHSSLTVFSRSAESDPFDPNAVIVEFPVDFGDPGEFTVATALASAVMDRDQQGNPEGDYPLGTVADVERRQGETLAPDLLEVRDIRTGRGPLIDGDPTKTHALFVFDSQVYGDANGSALPGSGVALITARGVRVPCEIYSPSGAAVCTHDADVGPLGDLNVARGVVDAGTVRDRQASYHRSAPNPLQAAPTPRRVNRSLGPDLVKATMSSDSFGFGLLTFTFDEGVEVPADASGFCLYRADASQFCGGHIERNVSRPSDGRISVEIPSQDWYEAVGVSVAAGAVRGTASGLTNHPDALGVTNIESEQRQPGRTDQPELVSIEREGDPVTADRWLITYRFDERLKPAGPENPFASDGFQVYWADGSSATCRGGAIAEDDPREYVCSVSGQAAPVLGAVRAGSLLSAEDARFSANRTDAEAIP